ncbi:MAG: SnoaL-like domain-containing protein [Mycobacteriaceae bacterium]|nr:SnoaL-like domain-containing protein [Mycobacteriaceae bacterium]
MTTTITPAATVQLFLESMASGDLETAVDLLDADVEYTNVSLPTLRGARATAKVIRGLNNSYAGFAARMVNVATEGDVVLTERIDELRIGPVRMQFWVIGRFEVHGGRITVWRDYFDWFDIAKSLVRGLLAIPFPSIQRPLAKA